MRVALRGVAVGPSAPAALTHAVRDALLTAGCIVELEPIDAGGAHTGADAPNTASWTGDAVPPDVHVQVGAAADIDPDVPGRVRVALICGGLDDLQLGAVRNLRAMDEVWVTDPGVAGRAVSAGMERDRVWFVPEPINLTVAEVVGRTDIPGTRGTVVLSMLEWGADWGWHALIAAWAQAFGPSNAVTLVISAWAPVGATFSGSDAGTAIMAHLTRLGIAHDRVADMVLLADPLDGLGRAGLIAASDVVVDPGRGGVLRRPAREALAHGRAVVGPGVPDGRGWPVDQRFAPTRRAGEPPRRLRENDPASLAAALRAAVSDPDERDRRALLAAQSAELNDHRTVGATMLVRLADLAARSAGPARPPRPRVLLSGSLYGAHSLAGVNRGLGRALLRRGDLDVALANTEGAQLDPNAPVDASVRSLVWATAPRLGRADVEIRHGHPADLTPTSAKRLVSILNWEFGGAPIGWIDALNGAIDETWVLTPYVRDGWLSAGADPERVQVVPAGFDPTVFHPRARPYELGTEAPGYRFLFVGGLAWRKGVDLLIEAYRTAFTRDDDVTLVMKDFGAGGPYQPDGTERLVDELAADPRAPRVLRLSGAMGESELPGLYTACDCLVHPYRAEAYGMTMVEAMACGRPVIAPDRGAARAFMDCETALLVPSRRVELDVDRIADHRVAAPPVVHEVDVAAMAEVMRWAYENHGGAVLIGDAARRHVHAGHTWDHAARILVERVRTLVDPAAAQTQRDVA